MPISFPKGGVAAAAKRSSQPTHRINNDAGSSIRSVSSTSAASASTPSDLDDDDDSSSDLSSDYDSDYEDALVREEWEESLRQMQALVSLVLLPFFGKWWGRRWSYWGEQHAPGFISKSLVFSVSLELIMHLNLLFLYPFIRCRFTCA